MQQSAIAYDDFTTSALWTEAGETPEAYAKNIFVHDVKDFRFFSLPIDFLRRSGRNDWTFVLELLQLCVIARQKVELYRKPRQNEDAEEEMDSTEEYNIADLVPVDLASEPAAGVFIALRADRHQEQFTFRKGPEGKTRGALPTGTTATGPTASGTTHTPSETPSSRSSTQQTQFRAALLARDGVCILSGHEADECHAAHIVPKGRSDVYAKLRILGADKPYGPTMGLLLKSDYHDAWDRYKWALYPDDNGYTVHWFTRDVDNRHGKRIEKSFFRSSQYPRTDLLMWHYTQCVLMRLRGFSHDMHVEAIRADIMANASTGPSEA